MATRKEHNKKYNETHAAEIAAQKKLYNMAHAEERNTKAKTRRESWTPEQREAERERKREYNKRPEVIAARKVKYADIAEAKNAKARAKYAEKRALLDQDNIKKTRSSIYKYLNPAPKPAKVIDQPINTITLKEIAKDLGASVFLLREIIKEPAFNMPKVKMLRIDGVDLYDIFEAKAWMQTYKEALISRVILGTSKRKTGGITLTEDIMLFVDWVKRSAHIEQYTLRSAQESASKALCARYGVKSLLDIK